MGNEQIKAQVREALKQQWEEFAARHPALARAMDQEMLTEMCMTDLRENPEFKEAIRAVEEAPLFADMVQGTVTRLVKAWIG